VGKRAVAVGAIAVLALLLLAGCQSVPPGTFVRAQAQADVAGWTHDARDAAGSPVARTTADGYETCRTDTAYFSTSFQWRTITNLSVSASRQAAATSAISAAFVKNGWVETKSSGLVTLAGPHDASRRGILRIETAGSSQLAVSAISPCYR
jgi:hypothetical protein